MERLQSLQFWSILGPNLLPENQNHCYRPTSLGISNNVSLRSQKNHIILVKLSNFIFRGEGEVQNPIGPILGGLGGNNSSKELQIELIFWSQVVLIVAEMSFRAFWKTQIFTVTGHTQSLSFWSNFDHSLTPEDGRNQK